MISRRHRDELAEFVTKTAVTTSAIALFMHRASGRIADTSVEVSAMAVAAGQQALDIAERCQRMIAVVESAACED
ncbi:hypothetical protein [Amycolatopsis sp. H20-H5]|uniref:hypothetical protein n=1 Tax=Amycolatopsis sp. H20-H5 TaxID=3046309 RepID=UPI002DBF7F73|nr:hypothetical protein [Amycolatopsis sp. H20-H5]MEC3974859.1 hypothetical protein [Amycolatopsis sp. H20-H5]